MKVLITTVPFSDKNRLPLDLLEQNGIDYLINPLNKKLTEDELVEMAVDFDAIIAGTEPITKKVMDAANKLRIISRVGIGVTDTGKFYYNGLYFYDYNGGIEEILDHMAYARQLS